MQILKLSFLGLLAVVACSSSASVKNKDTGAAGASGTTNTSGSTGIAGSAGTSSSGASGGSDGAGGDTNVSGSGGASTGSGGTNPTNCTDTLCGSDCANLGTSADHCGACNHSCGGGKCTLGRCEPVPVHSFTNGVTIGAIGVGATEVYFSTSENKLLACPKSGCKLQPRQIAAMSYGIPSIVAAAHDFVAFESAPTQSTQRPAIYACPSAGCASPLTSVVSDGLNGFENRLVAAGDRVIYRGGGIGLGYFTCTAGGCATPTSFSVKGMHAISADLDNAYFVGSSTGGSVLSACKFGVTPCTPAQITPGDKSSVPRTQAFGGRLYWLLPGREDFIEGKVQYCALGKACDVGTNLVSGLDSPAEFVVATGGTFWFTKTKPKLQRCAPNDCAGGAADATEELAAPHALVADDAFVYWAEGGIVKRVAQ